MAARAIWTGVLKLDGRSIPVKLYSAVQDRAIHFHLLDSKNHNRVKQHMVDPETGKEVPSDGIRRGVEVEPGVFVMVSEEELARLEPDASREIHISRFLPGDRINHQWYERPYYLGPDANAADAYFELGEALEEERCEGLAKWVMRKKPYVGALRAQDGYLLLIALRNSDEVLLPQELPEATGRAADDRELKMAEQLVGAFEGNFDPAAFHDEYRDRVMRLIEAKGRGEKPKLLKMPRREPTTDLLDTLAASLKAAQRRTGGAHG